MSPRSSCILYLVSSSKFDPFTPLPVALSPTRAQNKAEVQTLASSVLLPEDLELLVLVLVVEGAALAVIGVGVAAVELLHRRLDDLLDLGLLGVKVGLLARGIVVLQPLAGLLDDVDQRLVLPAELGLEALVFPM